MRKRVLVEGPQVGLGKAVMPQDGSQRPLIQLPHVVWELLRRIHREDSLAISHEPHKVDEPR